MIGYVFALLCLVGGVLGFPWAVGYAADAAASPGWPTVQGEILERDVVSSDRSATTNGRVGSSSSHTPVVRYRYTVADQPYESDQFRLDFYASYNTYGEAFDELGPYRLNLPVDVYYDPADPANAVLDPGGDWRSYRPLVFAGAAMLLGIATLVYTRHSASQRIARLEEREAKKLARAAAKRAAKLNPNG